MTPKQHKAQQAVADRINDAIALTKPSKTKRVFRALRTIVKTAAMILIALVFIFAFGGIKTAPLADGSGITLYR